MQEVETTLYHLPKPSKQHIDSLEQLLQRVRAEQGLSAKDLRDRQEVAAQVDEFLRPVVKGEKDLTSNNIRNT